MYTYVYIYVYVHIYICIHLYIYVYIYTYIHKYKCTTNPNAIKHPINVEKSTNYLVPKDFLKISSRRQLLYKVIDSLAPEELKNLRIFFPKTTYDFWEVHVVQGGEDSSNALSCRSFLAKEPIIIGFFCGK